jgi:RNA-directed DNA polymerase
MTEEQQKKQLKLTFSEKSRGETPSETGRGAEEGMAVGEAEVPVPESLMEEVANALNLKEAYFEVKANRGAPGIDGMTVEQLGEYLLRNRDRLSQSLLDGTYKPTAVKRVEIPKPGGGTRKLGIPTAVDRLVQQAILRVVQRYWDRSFSEYSFGFRPNRSAQQAVQQAQKYVSSGQQWVVDIDLEKFFDSVNHDVLMALVAKRVKDKRLLKLIRAFLNAGVMEEGVVIEEKEEGTPQGGPLSPWLSNVMLDELDKELEKRHLNFVRYADDCNIYVASERAGKRVMEGITNFVGKKLRLKVNEEKSAVGRPWERKFLGFTYSRSKLKVQIAPKSIDRAKDKLRKMTSPMRGGKLVEIIEELSKYLTGWRQYYSICELTGEFRDIERWLRRRLRSLLWTRWKTGKRRFEELTRRGVAPQLAQTTAGSSKGPWHLSASQALSMALPNKYFEDLGLPRIYSGGTQPPNRRVRTRTHGGVAGRNP